MVDGLTMAVLQAIPTPPPFRAAAAAGQRPKVAAVRQPVDLSALAEPIATLDGLLLITSPYGLVADSWLREEIAWDVPGLALHLNDVARSANNSIDSLGRGEHRKTMVTVEHGDRVIAVASCSEDLLVGCVFSSAVSLGLVRLEVERIRRTLAAAAARIQRPQGPPPRTERAIPSVG